MSNVHRTTAPRIFAALALAPYLRSAVTALLAVAAVFIASRRLAGALGTSLGPFPLLIAGGLLAGLAWIAHAPAQTGRLRAGNTLISLAMLVIAASLSFLPGSHAIALLGFWAVIVGEELWAWRMERAAGGAPAQRVGERGAKSGERGAGRSPSYSPLPYSGAGQGVRAPVPAGSGLTEEIEPTEPAADVLQQLTLRTTAEGGQELSGWLRIRLIAGQRTGNLHVAFCPSFDRVPQVQAEAVSGPDCRIKAAQVLPYGARLDVKLDEAAAKDESVLVWFHAAVAAA